MAEAQTVRVTYREIAERFGIGIEGARLKAKRRAAKGVWRIIPGNHPLDAVRIEMPESDFGSVPQRGPPHATVEGTPTSRPPHDPERQDQRRDTHDLDALVEIVSQLTAQTQAITDRLIEAERARADAERDSAVVRAELKSAETRLMALQESHLSELKALRDRLETDVGQARAQESGLRDQLTRAMESAADDKARADAAALELLAWRARPWWRRLRAS
jgi:hypothetical protein